MKQHPHGNKYSKKNENEKNYPDTYWYKTLLHLNIKLHCHGWLTEALWLERWQLLIFKKNHKIGKEGKVGGAMFGPGGVHVKNRRGARRG